jgi:RecA-family ATPase
MRRVHQRLQQCAVQGGAAREEGRDVCAEDERTAAQGVGGDDMSNVIKLPALRYVRRPILTPKQWMERRIEPTDHLLGELFSTSTRALFSADTGLGKTMIGLGWAFAMALGRDFMHWSARRPARVLYIDGEMPRDLIQERIGEACKWFDVEAREVFRIAIASTEDFEEAPPLDTDDGQAWLNEFIAANGPFDFIFFDNIMSLCSASMKEEDSWQAMKGFVKSLTKRRIGQLWLHHTGHDKSRAYGTKTREWQMDTVMVGEKEEGEADISFMLRFKKARRRKPSNRHDYREMHIQLFEGGWKSDQQKAELSESEKVALKALRNAIAKHDEAVTEDAWRAEAYELGISKSEQARAKQIAFKRAKDALLESGEVVKDTEGKFDIARA